MNLLAKLELSVSSCSKNYCNMSSIKNGLDNYKYTLKRLWKYFWLPPL